MTQKQKQHSQQKQNHYHQLPPPPPPASSSTTTTTIATTTATTLTCQHQVHCSICQTEAVLRCNRSLARPPPHPRPRTPHKRPRPRPGHNTDPCCLSATQASSTCRCASQQCLCSTNGTHACMQTAPQQSSIVKTTTVEPVIVSRSPKGIVFTTSTRARLQSDRTANTVRLRCQVDGSLLRHEVIQKVRHVRVDNRPMVHRVDRCRGATTAHTTHCTPRPLSLIPFLQI